MEIIRKPNGLKCTNCSTPLVGRQRKWCKKSCRARHNEKKGIQAPPSFLNKMTSKGEKRIGELIKQPTRAVFRAPNEEIKHWENSYRYWEKVYYDAKKGVYSMATLTGGGIGVTTGKDTEEKIVNGIIGGMIGKVIDNWRQKDTMKHALDKIEECRYNIQRLKRIQTFVSSTNKLKLKDDKVVVSENFNLNKTENLKLLSNTMTNAEDYRKLIIPSLEIEGEYKYLMGDIDPNFYMVIHGLPGQGKSTFTIDFANYLQKKYGGVVFMAAEQSGENAALKNLLEKKDAKFAIETQPNLYDTDKWIEVCSHFNFVVIDSASTLKMSPIQIKNIREKSGKTGFIVILQSTKDGDFKGDQAWWHDCNVFMKASKGTMYQVKSQYGTPPTDIPIKFVNI